jgi:hypothetical protein
VAVSHDASTESHTGTTVSQSEASFNWSHTVGASANYLWVVTCDLSSTTHAATAVDVGGNAMTDLSVTAQDSAAEPSSGKLWGLANPPTGAQTITVTRTNNTNGVYAVAASQIGTGTLEVYVTGVATQNDDGALSEISVDDGSPGTNSLRYAVGYTGDLNAPGTGANSTALQSIDIGPRAVGAVRETTAGQGARSVGLTSPSDDRWQIGFAVREAGGGAQTVTIGGLIDQAGTLFAPQANFTVFPGLVDQSGVTFAPKANLGVTVPLISQAGTLFAPQVNFKFSPGLIDRSGTLFTPQVNFKILFPLIDQSGTTFAPVVSIGSGPQTVSPGLISQAGTLFAPQVNFKIFPGLITQTATAPNPKVNFGISFPLISQIGTPFAPSVGGSQTVTVGLITQAGVMFSPVLFMGSAGGIIVKYGAYQGPAPKQGAYKQTAKP